MRLNKSKISLSKRYLKFQYLLTYLIPHLHFIGQITFRLSHSGFIIMLNTAFLIIYPQNPLLHHFAKPSSPSDGTATSLPDVQVEYSHSLLNPRWCAPASGCGDRLILSLRYIHKGKNISPRTIAIRSYK